MATKSELNRWIENAKRTLDRYQRTVTDCDKLIARLEPVYKELGEIKRDFRNTRKSIEDIIEEKGKWYGETYTSFCDAGSALDDVCGAYYKRLDAAQDAVNVKIGDLRAQKRELVPLIGGLWGQIEKWRVDIENIGN